MSVTAEPRGAAISLARLFLLVISLKIGSSLAAWYFQSPWVLGFFLPLSLMLFYIGIGLSASRGTLSDEKFADSCYYLGFIFTISSIVVGLFDLPALDTRLADIAIRFGAAMVSTVLGLIVRVYLVSFRAEFQDDWRLAEENLLDAARAFRTHLELAVERLADFQRQVDSTARDAVSRIELTVETAAAEHSRRFGAVFEDIVRENRKVSKDSVMILQNVADELAKSQHAYMATLISGTGRLDGALRDFSNRLTERLEQVEFPDDYFTSRLAPSVQSMAELVESLHSRTKTLAEETERTAARLNSAIDRLIAGSEQVGSSVDVLRGRLSSEADMVTSMQEQARLFGKLAALIQQLDTTLEDAITHTQLQTRTSRELLNQLSPLVLHAGGVTTEKHVD